MTNKFLHGDALEIMPHIPDKSVEAIIADPPFGTTACKWDCVIDFAAMWSNLERIIKPGGAIVLFASQPFTAALIMSKPKLFRYSWVNNKSHPSGFQYAKFRPMQKHEDICVFGKGRLNYYPQMIKGEPKLKRIGKPETARDPDTVVGAGVKANLSLVKSDLYFPTTSLAFGSGARAQSIHRTQKPLELVRYLVRTYTRPSETVLDFCAGSATLPVACIAENRNFIGIEKDAAIYALAMERVKNFLESKS